MFHRTLLDMPDTFSSFCSTPPQTTPDSLLLTRIKRTPCATPPAGMLFGHLAESSPHTISSVEFFKFVHSCGRMTCSVVLAVRMVDPWCMRIFKSLSQHHRRFLFPTSSSVAVCLFVTLSCCSCSSWLSLSPSTWCWFRWLLLSCCDSVISACALLVPLSH